jgi:hypothetical protein
MNEYQDQVTVRDSRGKLITISDHDTRVEAESAPVPSWARNARVVRRSGLPS